MNKMKREVVAKVNGHHRETIRETRNDIDLYRWMDGRTDGVQ